MLLPGGLIEILELFFPPEKVLSVHWHPNNILHLCLPISTTKLFYNKFVVTAKLFYNKFVVEVSNSKTPGLSAQVLGFLSFGMRPKYGHEVLFSRAIQGL